MIIVLKRTTDNKYLQSLEGDIWVDNIKDAFEMSYREFNETKNQLLNTYSEEQLKEITNLAKYKTITSEERKEIFSLLKK